jgi:hypothetical protein
MCQAFPRLALRCYDPAERPSDIFTIRSAEQPGVANCLVFASMTDHSPQDIKATVQPFPIHSTPQMHPLFGLAWSPRILWYTSLEAILESAWNTLHVAHASSTSSLSPLCLLAPVVCKSALAKISPNRVPFLSR